MGHAAAEAVVAAGLNLVPFTLTGYSAGVAVSNVGIRGIPVELVGRDRRQEVMQQILQKHPNLIVVDYTTPYCVNGETAAVVPAQQAAAACTAMSQPQTCSSQWCTERCTVTAVFTQLFSAQRAWQVSCIGSATLPVLPTPALSCLHMQTMPSSTQTTVCLL